MARCTHCGGSVVLDEGEAACLSCGRRPGSVAPALPRWRAQWEGPGSVAQGAPWTEEEAAFVMAHLADMTIEEIARELGRPTHGVQHWLSDRRIAKPRVSRRAKRHSRRVSRPGARWTPEEDAALEDASEAEELINVATLKRSRAAVYMRRSRLGLAGSSGWLTVSGVAQLYGCPRRRVEALVRSGLLPASRLANGRWRIDPHDAERVSRQLHAPKRTWQATKPDVGRGYLRRR